MKGVEYERKTDEAGMPAPVDQRSSDHGHGDPADPRGARRGLSQVDRHFAVQEAALQKQDQRPASGEDGH